MGIVYDLQHWGQLVPDKGQSKAGFVFLRDDRIFYILCTLIFFLIAILVLRMMFGSSGGEEVVIDR